MKYYPGRQTYLNEFIIGVGTKTYEKLIKNKDKLARMWNDYIKLMVKRKLVNPQSAIKWPNPFNNELTDVK
jgi:hypothetical protein